MTKTTCDRCGIEIGLQATSRSVHRISIQGWVGLTAHPTVSYEYCLGCSRAVMVELTRCATTEKPAPDA